MIIDAHTHADEFEVFGWMDPPARLVELMAAAGIDKSLVTTYADEPGPAAGLANLERYVDEYPDKLIGFPRFDPKYGKKALDAFESTIRNNKRMRGLKLHPVSNLVKPFAPLCLAFLRKAAELEVPVFFHCGDQVLALPLQIARAAALCPETTIICHMGGYFHAEESIRIAAKLPNLVLDTSSCPYLRLIRTAIDKLGPKRVVFASDSPAGDPISEVKKIMMLGLPKEVEERVLWRNIAEILHIEGGTT